MKDTKIKWQKWERQPYVCGQIIETNTNMKVVVIKITYYKNGGGAIHLRVVEFGGGR